MRATRSTFFQRGSLSKQGIIKELLEKVWYNAYNIKDETKATKHEIKTREIHNRTGLILEKYDKERRDRTSKRKDAFSREYHEIKALFAFGKFDEALKRLKKMQEKEW